MSRQQLHAAIARVTRPVGRAGPLKCDSAPAVDRWRNRGRPAGRDHRPSSARASSAGFPLAVRVAAAGGAALDRDRSDRKLACLLLAEVCRRRGGRRGGPRHIRAALRRLRSRPGLVPLGWRRQRREGGDQAGIDWQRGHACRTAFRRAFEAILRRIWTGPAWRGRRRRSCAPLSALRSCVRPDCRRRAGTEAEGFGGAQRGVDVAAGACVARHEPDRRSVVAVDVQGPNRAPLRDGGKHGPASPLKGYRRIAHPGPIRTILSYLLKKLTPCEEVAASLFFATAWPRGLSEAPSGHGWDRERDSMTDHIA